MMGEGRKVTMELGPASEPAKFWEAAAMYAQEVLIKREIEAQQGRDGGRSLFAPS
jgi:hypothetical protein